MNKGITENLFDAVSVGSKIGELVSATPSFLEKYSPKAASYLTKRKAESLLAVIRAANEKLNRAGITDQERQFCALKLGIPLIENASLEEEPELRELWANLLANSFNPEYNGEIRTIFVDIIKKLTPFDAAVLNAYGNSNYLPFKYVENKEKGCCEYLLWTAKGYIDVDVDKIRESFLVLKSLSLLNNVKASSDFFTGGKSILSQTDYYLTGLGRSFFKACLVDAGQHTKDAAFQKSSHAK